MDHRRAPHENATCRGGRAPEYTRLVLAEGLRLTLLGIVLGVATALSLGEWVAGALHEVAPTDPVLLTVAAGVLVGAALAASYYPARAASQVDPATALRSE
jgi:ABC-type antimicrobial peptide transport system permease subunit